MTDPTKVRRVRLRIIGRVQGVGFRYSALEAARRIGVCGWVRNCDDGAVEAVAEGEQAAIAQFVRWCHRGPAGARVTQVRELDEPPAGDSHDFAIRR